MQDQRLCPDPRIFVNLITQLGDKDTRPIHAALVEIIGQFGSFQVVDELVGKAQVTMCRSFG